MSQESWADGTISSASWQLSLLHLSATTWNPVGPAGADVVVGGGGVVEVVGGGFDDVGGTDELVDGGADDEEEFLEVEVAKVVLPVP